MCRRVFSGVLAAAVRVTAILRRPVHSKRWSCMHSLLVSSWALQMAVLGGAGHTVVMLEAASMGADCVAAGSCIHW
jgi:hypothetical protein